MTSMTGAIPTRVDCSTAASPRVEDVLRGLHGGWRWRILTQEGVDAYLEARARHRQAGARRRTGAGIPGGVAVARQGIGRGRAAGGHGVIARMQKSPNGHAITPFLQTLAPVARAPADRASSCSDYLDISAGSDGAHHRLHPRPPHRPSPAPACRISSHRRRFCSASSALGGLKNWVDYGVRNYRSHPERQKDYFSLQSADSRAVLQRERHGTLLVDVERKLDLYLRGLWQDSDQLVPYSTAFDELRKPVPYLRQARHPPAGCVRRRRRHHAASTATAPCWPTSSATGAGPRRRSPTT